MSYRHITFPESGQKISIADNRLVVPDNPILGFVLFVCVDLQQRAHAILAPCTLGGHARHIERDFPATDLVGAPG